MEQDLKQQQDQPPSQPRRTRPLENPTSHQHHHHQPPPPQRCPRCDSVNTKFCYYNNYSLSQPRYFCKACRRYWTHGGTLRNVPVGGGCRKGKRPKTSASSSGEGGRSQSQPLSATLPPHNLTGMAGMISGSGGGILSGGQSFRALPGPMNSLYSGGGFLSSLAAMQSLSQQPLAGNLVGGGQFGGGATGVGLFSGLNLPPLKPQQPPFQGQNEFFSSQQSMVPQQTRPVGSWTQSFMANNTAASSSAGSTSFWTNPTGGAANTSGGAGGSSVGPSLSPSPWSDTLPGFNPSQ